MVASVQDLRQGQARDAAPGWAHREASRNVSLGYDGRGEETCPSPSLVQNSCLMQFTTSFWEEISIPDKCLSNFLINFNKIKTSLGKSATQTLG